MRKLLPETLLRYRTHGNHIYPSYLDERDHPWLRALLSEFERFVGKPRRELVSRLKEALPTHCEPAKKKLVSHFLEKSVRGKTASPLPPKTIRQALFEAAAQADASRSVVIGQTAQKLGIAPSDLEEWIFADLALERKVLALTPELTAGEIVLRVNLLIAQSLLCRASEIALEIQGNSRAVVRHAKFRGLICTVEPRSNGAGVILKISGPFSLFRKTLLYGRALGELLPILAWCDHFHLEAQCGLRERAYTLNLQSGEPFSPSKPPAPFDSKLENRFAREFKKRAPEWDLIREPEPFVADQTLIFPDFLLQHRREPSLKWILEIAGFWPPLYVSQKLKRLRAADIPNLILCIDISKNCAETELDDFDRVIRFRGKLPVEEVIRMIDFEMKTPFQRGLSTRVRGSI